MPIPFVCIHIYLNMLNTVTSLHPASQEIELVEYSEEIKDPTTVNTCRLHRYQSTIWVARTTFGMTQNVHLTCESRLSQKSFP